MSIDAPAGPDPRAVTGTPTTSASDPPPGGWPDVAPEARPTPDAHLELRWLGDQLAAALRWDPEPAPWADPPGRGATGAHGVAVEVRVARPMDLVGLEGFVARCSDTSVYRRFHGAAKAALRRELTRVVEPTPRYRSWVAVADGEIRGVVSLAVDEASRRSEVGILVEDEWQRRGVGRALLRAVSRQVVRDGLPSVTAEVLGDNTSALRFFAAVAPPATRSLHDGIVELVIPVPSVVRSASAPPRAHEPERAFGAAARQRAG